MYVLFLSYFYFGTVCLCSLSTRPAKEGQEGRRATMNLLTYASAVAIAPVRCYALGLFVGTVSWQNMKETGKGVMQVGPGGGCTCVS